MQLASCILFEPHIFGERRRAERSKLDCVLKTPEVWGVRRRKSFTGVSAEGEMRIGNSETILGAQYYDVRVAAHTAEQGARAAGRGGPEQVLLGCN